MNGLQLAFTERFCIEIAPVPCVSTIFGASGDLAMRKLFPALYQLHMRQLLHTQSQIIGVGRTDYTTESFQAHIRESLLKFSKTQKCSDDCFEAFIKRIRYFKLDYAHVSDYEHLNAFTEQIELAFSTQGNRLFYLALPSSLYLEVIAGLDKSKLMAYQTENTPYRNVILEKPFGNDYESAVALDTNLKMMLKEEQIYRIDHYLGKETVQNIVMLRFANTMFEPLLNRTYVERVEIEALETLTIGNRAGYYDGVGCVRDMFQNHLLALLSFVAMDAPKDFSAESIRNARITVLKSIRPWSKTELDQLWKRAQYEGYLQEKGVTEHSQTETFAEGTFFLDNWRWDGVPFVLRSGKALNERTTRIKIVFKHIPHSIFTPLKPSDLEQNVLQINIQPEEGISLNLQMKKPGPKKCMGTLKMGYHYDDLFEEGTQEAYERLLLDAMLGDPMLYLRNDSIEESWKLLDPLLQYWKNSTDKIPCYPIGSSHKSI